MTTQKTPMFELVVQVRDGVGNPTGQTKYISSDNAEDLEGFFNRYNPKIKKKNNKKKAKRSANGLKNKILKNLIKIKGLEKNWDDNEALPVNAHIVANAEKFINSIGDIISFQPKIIPMAESDLENGGSSLKIYFQNFKTSKELELFFVHTDYIKCSFYDPIEKTEVNEVFTIDKVSEIRKFVQQIYK